MAIFQPSNITPSTLSGSTGTIDASDNIAISWQVNGNSPLTAYQIDIYEGNASTTTYTTNKVTHNDDSQLPFYGKDEKGNYIQFVPELTGTWSSKGLSNGKNYRMKITQYWNNGSEQTVNQYSETAFITRANPTLAITPVSGGDVVMVVYTFTATYAQANGDVIKWAQWQLTNNTTDTVIEDTGHIDTPVLEYTYSGFLNGNNYTLSCTVETENGVTVSDDITFDVVYTEDAGTGNINLKCTSDNAALLSWTPAVDIPGVCTPANAYSITDNVLSLNSGATITWDTVDGEAMAFSEIYSLGGRWKNKPTASAPSTISEFSGIDVIQFDSQGETAVVFADSGSAIYQFANGAFTRIGGYLITKNVAISPDGNHALYYRGQNLYVLEINGSTVTDVANTETKIEKAIGFIDNTHFFSAMADDMYAIKVFTISGGSISAGTVNTLSVSTLGAGLKNRCIANSTGEYVIVWESGKAVICSVSGETLTEEYTFIPSNSSSFVDCKFVTINGIEHFAMIEYNSTDIESKIRIHQFDTNLSDFGKWILSRSVTDRLQSISSTDGKIAASGNVAVYLYNLQLYNTETQMAEVYVATFEHPAYIYSRCCLVPEQSQLIYGTAGHSPVLVTFDTTLYNILSISDGNGHMITIDKQEFTYIIGHQGTPTPIYRALPNSADTVFISLAYNKLRIWAFENGVIGSGTTMTLTTPSQMGIASITLYGEQECEYLYITKNLNYDYSAYNYTPAYDSETLFYASFQDDLQAGTLSASGTTSNVIYRLNDNKLLPIATLPTTVNEIKDFGIRSNQLYSYRLYYLNNGVYSSAISSDGSVCRQLRSYTLMEGVQDTEYPDTYHIINTWIFGNNIDMSGVSNGNNPSLQANFTKYPYRQNNSQAPKSGTLQALLSNVTDDGQYADTAEQQERLFAISQSTNDFFLKDMKGNIYQVHTSAPITQTQNTKTAYLETTVSVPWVEVGDASNVSLIQTEWDNTNTLNGGILRTQSKTVPLLMPTTDMTVTPDSGYLLSSVTILKPNSLQPSTIKKGVDIGGVIGTFEAHLQNKTVSPSYVTQTITPDNGYDGMANVTINHIDNDIMPKDYNFYDYDGKLLYSYSTAELGALTELPDVPEHNGLTSQGWNWTLGQLQALTYPMDISAIYYPDDGKTRLYIEIPYDNYTMTNYIRLFASPTAIINWGDGDTYTDTTSGSHTISHTYASKGRYVVTYDVTSGYLLLGQSGKTLLSADTTSYADNSILTCLILGNNTTLSGSSTLTNCNLQAFSPNFNPNGLGSSGFSLANSSVPFVGVYATAYNNSIAITDGNVNVISVPYRANNQTLTATGTNIRRICLSPNTTAIPNAAFSGCSYLTEIYFNKCSIGGAAFANCYSLNYLKINTSFIFRFAFENCTGVKYFDFTSCTTVPTLQNSNAFSGTTGQIIVPDSLYSTWIAASQWSNLASRIIKESDM